MWSHGQYWQLYALSCVFSVIVKTIQLNYCIFFIKRKHWNKKEMSGSYRKSRLPSQNTKQKNRTKQKENGLTFVYPWKLTCIVFGNTDSCELSWFWPSRTQEQTLVSHVSNFSFITRKKTKNTAGGCFCSSVRTLWHVHNGIHSDNGKM